jgi:YD repeat-containing protein
VVYDSLGRVLANRRTTNSVTKVFSYQYNLDGSVWKITYPTGRTITYSYNAAARALSAVDTAAGVNYAINAGYAPHGALASLQNGANLVSTFFYNNRLQPCRISLKSSGSAPANCASGTLGNVLDFAYSFDTDPGPGGANNGNVMSWAAAGEQTFNRSYTYDELNRLKTMAAPGETCSGLSWSYDGWANRTHQTVTGGTCGQSWLTINIKNQIADTGFQYDAAGNMIAEPGKTYQYDAENRMKSVNSGGGSNPEYTEFTPSLPGGRGDADPSAALRAGGKRIRKKIGTTLSEYVYNAAGQVVAERKSTNGGSSWAWDRGYVYLGSQLLALFHSTR